MGKSGIIASYLAASFTPLGYPSFVLDPSAARWGELATLSPGDVLFLLSKSGSTDEVIKLVPFFRSKKVKLISIACVPDSPISRLCDESIYLPMERELCPFNLSPTTSPALYLLLCHACKSLIVSKGLPYNLAYNYPSSLHGRQLTLMTKDVMHESSALVFADANQSCMDVLPLLGRSGRGFVLAYRNKNDMKLENVGVFTDGDLRRAIGVHGYDALSLKLSAVMTQTPRYVHTDEPAVVALEYMNKAPTVSFLVVANREGMVCGVISRHQILDAQLVE